MFQVVVCNVVIEVDVSDFIRQGRDSLCVGGEGCCLTAQVCASFTLEETEEAECSVGRGTVLLPGKLFRQTFNIFVQPTHAYA